MKNRVFRVWGSGLGPKDRFWEVVYIGGIEGFCGVILGSYWGAVGFLSPSWRIKLKKAVEHQMGTQVIIGS